MEVNVTEILAELNAVLRKHGVTIEVSGYDSDFELVTKYESFADRKVLARLWTYEDNLEEWEI